MCVCGGGGGGGALGGGGGGGGQQSQSCHVERAACMFKKKVNSIKENCFLMLSLFAAK